MLLPKAVGVTVAAITLSTSAYTAAPAPPPTMTDCLTECANATALCLKVKPTSGSGLNASFQTLYGYLGRPGGTISPAELQEAFNVTSDPCKRGSTRITAGRITNVGARCYLSQDINFPTSTVGVVVIVPRNLRGRIVSKGPSYDLSFPRAGNSALLAVANPLLSSDWGGIITNVKFTGQDAVIRTEQGSTANCLDFAIGDVQ